ncbi:hypothetical protein NM688_g3144 [Phlebia brevispora]|uniref:Uncharacterized protein n=1 Tax=Phlebia brevispora TaxID=194682 RepID=A0ACC1T6Z5_9APHY|nr:hypothetical protein NM688_g3144 [Phlebia brevispora]
MAFPSSTATRRAVFVVGPSSSGKTTLCDALAKDLKLESDLYVKEVARHVMKTQGFTRNDTHTYEMQAAIMLAQIQAEQDALSCKHARSDILFLSDRSAIDPIVYAATSGAPNADDIKQQLQHVLVRHNTLPLYKDSLFVLLHPVAEWIVDDGVRSLQDPLNYNAQLCNILAELGIQFIEITSTLKELKDRLTEVRAMSNPIPSSQRAIFIVGPSSCGKTTLCHALAADLQLEPELYIQEMARVVMRTQGFTRDDIPAYAMQKAIMIAQLHAEKDAFRHRDANASILFLSDRSAIDPAVYAATSGSEEAEEISERLLRTPALQDNLPFYRRSLFVVLHAVPEWLVDDGIRSLKDPTNFKTHFCDLLTTLDIPYIEITPDVRDIRERVAIVKAHLRPKQHNLPEQSPSHTIARYRWRLEMEDDVKQYVMILAAYDGRGTTLLSHSSTPDVAARDCVAGTQFDSGTGWAISGAETHTPLLTPRFPTGRILSPPYLRYLFSQQGPVLYYFSLHYNRRVLLAETYDNTNLTSTGRASANIRMLALAWSPRDPRLFLGIVQNHAHAQ